MEFTETKPRLDIYGTPQPGWDVARASAGPVAFTLEMDCASWGVKDLILQPQGDIHITFELESQTSEESRTFEHSWRLEGIPVSLKSSEQAFIRLQEIEIEFDTEGRINPERSRIIFIH